MDQGKPNPTEQKVLHMVLEEVLGLVDIVQMLEIFSDAYSI